MANTVPPPTRNSNFYAGLILIALGVILLFDRWLPSVSFRHLWPLVVIGFGVMVVLRSKTTPHTPKEVERTEEPARDDPLEAEEVEVVADSDAAKQGRKKV